MREKPMDKERLNHMIEAIDNIFEFVNNKSFSDYADDKMLRFAVKKTLKLLEKLPI